MRIALAILLGPIALGAVLLIIGRIMSSAPYAMVVIALYATALTFPIALVTGIPVRMILNKRGKTGLRHYNLAAIIIAAFPIIYFNAKASLRGWGGSEAVFESGLTLVCCLFIANFFWFVARPDKDPKAGKNVPDTR